MKLPKLFIGVGLLMAIALIAACSENPDSITVVTETVYTTDAASSGLFGPSYPIDAEPPYIAQEDCHFWLVTPNGVVSTSSEHGSGISGNATLNWGGYQMSVSECELIGNPQEIPFFTE